MDEKEGKGNQGVGTGVIGGIIISIICNVIREQSYQQFYISKVPIDGDNNNNNSNNYDNN